MATFNTTNYTAQAEARANPSRLADPNVASGTVEFAVIPYTIAGTEVATDIINLCLLPAGAIPIPALSHVMCVTDPGTAWTLKIGTAADDDGLAVSVAMTVPGLVSFSTVGATQPAFVVPTPIVADTGSGNAIVFATVVTATAITATTVTQFVIAYKRGR